MTNYLDDYYNHYLGASQLEREQSSQINMYMKIIF